MRKISILGVLVVGAALAVPTSAAPKRAAAGDMKLQRALDQLVAAGAPGAIALVRDGNRTIRITSGYADLKTKTPMRATDRFRIGSVTNEHLFFFSINEACSDELLSKLWPMPVTYNQV